MKCNWRGVGTVEVGTEYPVRDVEAMEVGG
jgi:hypothetical protein